MNQFEFLWAFPRLGFESIHEVSNGIPNVVHDAPPVIVVVGLDDGGFLRSDGLG